MRPPCKLCGALLLGLLLPFPGPHVDRYVPMIWAALQAPGASADLVFWVGWMGLWLAYGTPWYLLFLWIERKGDRSKPSGP